MGKADTGPQPGASDGAWGENWLNEHSRFERDTGRKRLVLEGLRDETAAWTVAGSPFPLDYAGTAVTARVRVQGAGDDHRAGVMLQARPAPNPKNPDGVALLSAMWGENKLWLHEYDAVKDDWQLLRSIPWPANGAAELTLRLVTRDDKAWVFVDGRLAMHHGQCRAAARQRRRPARRRPHAAGGQQLRLQRDLRGRVRLPAPAA